MFESGIGPGARSDRLGTWSLVSFVILFWAFSFVGVAAVIPAAICAATTLGAIACGLVGLVSPESAQRRAAVQGLLKTTPSVLIGGWFALLFWALLYGDWNFG